MTTLSGKQVLLREFLSSDAADVQRLAGDRAVADYRLSIPHPYEDGMAEQWIATLAPKIGRGELASFAVTLISRGELVGGRLPPAFCRDSVKASGNVFMSRRNRRNKASKNSYIWISLSRSL